MGSSRRYNQETFPQIWDDFGREETHELVDYSEVTHAKAYITVKHRVCGSLLRVRCDHFFAKLSNCRICNQRLTRILLGRGLEFSKYNNAFVNELFTLKEYSQFEWVNKADIVYGNTSRIDMRCNDCGGFTNSCLSNLLVTGPRCSVCSRNAQWSEAKVLYRFFQTDDHEEYSLVLPTIKYIKGAFEKFVVKHKKCAKYFAVSCDNYFTQGTRCPHCTISYGVVKIEKFLEVNSLAYTKEFMLSNLKNIRCLRYDFFIGKHKLIIEHHGKQHYEPVDFFGGFPAFQERQRLDAIKKQFALDNGYDFLEIPYWEFDNIEQILKDKLGL